MSDEKSIFKLPLSQADATSASSLIVEKLSCTDNEGDELLGCLRGFNATELDAVIQEVSCAIIVYDLFVRMSHLHTFLSLLNMFFCITYFKDHTMFSHRVNVSVSQSVCSCCC